MAGGKISDKVSHMMSPQLPGSDGWTSGSTKRRLPKNNLIFMIKPTTPLATGIHADAARHASSQGSKEAYPAELLHISLLCVDVGNQPLEPLIERAKAAAASIQARPIPITLDRTDLFGKERHLVLYGGKDNPLAVQFAHQLRHALERHNLPSYRIGKPTPHLTLIYNSGQIEPMPVERNYAWIASEFMLVHSHYGQSRHEEFGRWRFDPAAAPYPRPFEQLRLAV